MFSEFSQKTWIHLTKLNINRRNNKVFSLIIGYSLIAFSFNLQYKWSCSTSELSWEHVEALNTYFCYVINQPNVLFQAFSMSYGLELWVLCLVNRKNGECSVTTWKHFLSRAFMFINIVYLVSLVTTNVYDFDWL